MIEAVAAQVFIPLTVGGGVRSVADVRRLLNAGADKVSINTAAVLQPRSGRRGERQGRLAVHRGGDRRQTRARSRRPRRAGKCSRTAGGARPGWMRWSGAASVQQLGAGEILLTSMDRDGTRLGFDLELTRAFSDALEIPIIASGGVGNLEHLVEGVTGGPRRRGAGGEHLSLRRIHGAAGQGADGAAIEIEVRLVTSRRAASRRGSMRSPGRRTGLVPAIVQDAATRPGPDVRLDESRSAGAYRRATGEAHYWSRSRQRLWRKGEESGHVQKVQGAAPRLRRATWCCCASSRQGGIACHTGRERCFFRRFEDGRWVVTDPVLKEPARDLRPVAPGSWRLHDRCFHSDPAGADHRFAQECRSGLFLRRAAARQGQRRHPEEDRRGGGRNPAGG